MCRNHRGFIEATIAAAKVGADAMFLNTAFSGPQLADVARRENPAVIVYDEEFEGIIAEAAEGRLRDRGLAGARRRAPAPHARRHHAATATAPTSRRRPSKGKAILLTSGTTGTPKGASRSAAALARPRRRPCSPASRCARGRRPMIAAPLFHTWGFAHFTLGMSLSSTVVLRRTFDPEGILSLTARHECTALVVVPVMLQRILQLDDEVLGRYDLSKLRVVPVSGSALAPRARPPLDGPVRGEPLQPLRLHRGGVGDDRHAGGPPPRPRHGRQGPARHDRAGSTTTPARPCAQGETGRIFVGNEMQFEGYTGGGGKDTIDGLMSSGDVGHLDPEGRLFIDGRDDDMIISGGENVFPGEVEDFLAGHPAIAEVTVFGVPDEEWGERLEAVVVRRPGAELEADDVRGHVKANLASYKVPRDVRFVDELPRTATGKVLKRELRPR